MGDGTEPGGWRKSDICLRLLFSGGHLAELFARSPYFKLYPNFTRRYDYSSILHMRKLRPGKVLHQIRTWEGWLVPPTVAVPSSCVCGAYFGEAGREVVMSEGGWWVVAEGGKPGVPGREVKEYPGSPRLQKTCSLGDLTYGNLQLSPCVH